MGPARPQVVIVLVVACLRPSLRAPIFVSFVRIVNAASGSQARSNPSDQALEEWV